MHIGVNGRARWSAVVALIAGVTAGGTRMARAQDPVEGVALAVAGPRFLARAASRSSDAEPRWTDASNAAVFRKAISVDLKDVPLAEALAVIAQRAGLRLTYSAAVVPLDSRVTFSASNLTSGAALSSVLYDRAARADGCGVLRQGGRGRDRAGRVRRAGAVGPRARSRSRHLERPTGSGRHGAHPGRELHLGPQRPAVRHRRRASNDQPLRRDDQHAVH